MTRTFVISLTEQPGVGGSQVAQLSPWRRQRGLWGSFAPISVLCFTLVLRLHKQPKLMVPQSSREGFSEDSSLFQPGRKTSPRPQGAATLAPGPSVASLTSLDDMVLSCYGTILHNCPHAGSGLPDKANLPSWVALGESDLGSHAAAFSW